jgi:Ca-activated chloride channel family protein
MEAFHFMRPWWLPAALPDLILWWLIWRRQDSMALWRKLVEPHLLKHLLVGRSQKRILRPLNVLLAVWLLTVFALSGPTWQRVASPFGDEQAGLVVVLKVTESMLASDVQPTRLERAKHKLRDLLELRQGAPNGLIVYSGSAHLVMPLTKDSRIINAMAEGLAPEIMPEQGDVLSQALIMARDLLQKVGVTGSVLVMADSVTPGQIQAFTEAAPSLPVQFLAVQAGGTGLDPGLQEAAKAMNASVTRLSVDQTDIKQLTRRVKSGIQIADSAQGGQRWHDSGYALLPLIALGTLMWFRKGWVLR